MLNVLSTIACLVFGLIVVSYLMVLTMFCCYLMAEITLFTYVGALMEPSMAFRYVALAGAISVVLYKISQNLREKYDELRDEVVEILQKPNLLTNLCQDSGLDQPAVLQQEEGPNGNIKIHLNTETEPSKVVLYKNSFATFLSRPLHPSEKAIDVHCRSSVCDDVLSFDSNVDKKCLPQRKRGVFNLYHCANDGHVFHSRTFSVSHTLLGKRTMFSSSKMFTKQWLFTSKDSMVLRLVQNKIIRVP